MAKCRPKLDLLTISYYYLAAYFCVPYYLFLLPVPPLPITYILYIYSLYSL